MSSADLCEVFTSFQGEGLFAGKKQIFVRFSGCNLECSYCDTQYSKNHNGDALFESAPFSNFFIKERNPTPPFRLKDYINLYTRLDPSIESVSLTGGEPLLHTEFIKFFLENYKENREYHLETNGSLPERLVEIIDLIDFISMDIKVNFFHNKKFVELQRNFLIFSSKRNMQVKIVLYKDISIEKLNEAFILIADVNRNIPLILQPESNSHFNIEKLSRIYKLAKEYLNDVRILPQIHKFLKIR